MYHKRVAIQVISTGGVYGAERALLELAGYLRDQGWESHVVALEGRGAAELVSRAAAAGLPAEAFQAAGRLALWPMMRSMRRLLQRYPQAVVHSHGYKPDILMSVLGVPRRLPCLATCHSWYSETTKLKILEALDKLALRGFDHTVAVSPDIHQELIRSGVPPAKVSLISNGISEPRACGEARAEVREEFGIPPDGKLIVQIGRLARSKCNGLLLSAVAALPQALRPSVLLVGEGDQRQILQDSIRGSDLERRVRFCGYRSDTARILAAADLLALTSDQEGLPIVILEAMAMRCPIVATRVGAIPQVLSEDRDAWLVPVNDVTALASAIGQALLRPDDARSRAANAYPRFVRNYSRDAMGARYLTIYDDLWARRGWVPGGDPPAAGASDLT